MQPVFFGISLEIVAAGLGTVSKQMIAYAEHTKWCSLNALGVFVNVLVGPLFDASAYAFAPQTVVAPFASLDVIFNAISAPVTLRWQHEDLTRNHVIAALLVTVGASLSALFGTVHNDILTASEFQARLTRDASLMFLVCECLCLGVGWVMLQYNFWNKELKGMALGSIAGCLMGNMFFVKGLVGVVRWSIESGDWTPFRTPDPYIWAACAACGSVLGTICMQRALREYKGVYIVTIFEGSHIFMACLSGEIVMMEMVHALWLRYCAYWASILIVISGLLLMCMAAKDPEMIRRRTVSLTITQSGHDQLLNGADVCMPISD